MVGAESRGAQVTVAQVVRLGILLTLAAAVLMSVRFARFDWTGIPLEVLPDSVTVEVSDGCTEEVGSYVTSDGRTISPTTMDDEQYLAMVSQYRGVDGPELQVECLYRPYTGRFAQPWLAHLLPFDQGVSLALVNAAMLIGAVWAMLFALRSQGASPRALVFAGTFFALGWNTLLFGSVLLTDPGPLLVVSLGWLLVVQRRWLWCLALILVSIPVRETVLLLLPVLLVGIWSERAGPAGDGGGPPGVQGHHRWPLGPALLSVLAVVASAVAVVLWGGVAPDADATFSTQILIDNAIRNLFSPSIVTVLLAAGPLYVPALLGWWADVRRRGPVRATVAPAPVGLAATLALLGWVMLGADLSPRFTWVGFPFAAAMCAEYLDRGGLRSLLDRVAPERLVGAPRRGGSVVGSEF